MSLYFQSFQFFNNLKRIENGLETLTKVTSAPVVSLIFRPGIDITEFGDSTTKYNFYRKNVYPFTLAASFPFLINKLTANSDLFKIDIPDFLFKSNKFIPSLPLVISATSLLDKPKYNFNLFKIPYPDIIFPRPSLLYTQPFIPPTDNLGFYNKLDNLIKIINYRKDSNEIYRIIFNLLRIPFSLPVSGAVVPQPIPPEIPLGIPDFEKYLRRYLNDGLSTSQIGPPEQIASFSETDLIKYLRRYLNDKNA